MEEFKDRYIIKNRFEDNECITLKDVKDYEAKKFIIKALINSCDELRDIVYKIDISKLIK